MGVKELNKLVEKYGVDVELNVLNPGNKKRDLVYVAVDGSQSIYNMLLSTKGNTTTLASKIIYMITVLFTNGIIPVFVFDGSPPAEKADELERRKRRKTKHIIKCKKLINEKIILESRTPQLSRMESPVPMDDSYFVENTNIVSDIASTSTAKSTLPKYEASTQKPDAKLKELTKKITSEMKKCVKITVDIVNQVKTVLTLFGIPYIHIHDIEADIVCADLVKYGIVDSCISEDTDMFLFGCTKIIHNFLANRNTSTVTLFEMDTVLDGLGITYSMFVDMCILLGTEYTKHYMRNVKPAVILELIRKYETIDSIQKNIDKIKLDFPEHNIVMPDLDNFDFKSARKLIFGSLPREKYTKYMADNAHFAFDRFESTVTLYIQDKKYAEMLKCFFTDKEKGKGVNVSAFDACFSSFCKLGANVS